MKDPKEIAQQITDSYGTLTGENIYVGTLQELIVAAIQADREERIGWDKKHAEILSLAKCMEDRERAHEAKSKEREREHQEALAEWRAVGGDNPGALKVVFELLQERFKSLEAERDALRKENSNLANALIRTVQGREVQPAGKPK